MAMTVIQTIKPVESLINLIQKKDINMKAISPINIPQYIFE